MSSSTRSRLLLAVLTALFFALPAVAQFDGARVYWPLPKNTNIVSGTYLFGSANATWSNWTRIEPQVDVRSDMFVLGYTRVQPILGRTAMWQLLLPAATIDTDTPASGTLGDEFSNGLGDLMIAGTINLFGVPGLKAKEFVRNDLGWSVNLGVTVTAPTGDYDPDELVNVGADQWKTRVSLPVVRSLSAWVPGRRTTLEVMPFATFFGSDPKSGQVEIDQDPVYGVEAHLTRDVTDKAFLSLDYTVLDGGEETRSLAGSGVKLGTTPGIDAQLLGVTMGFEVNDHMNLFVTHMQTISEDGDRLQLEGSVTKVTLSWSWHDVLEKVRRFRNS